MIQSDLPATTAPTTTAEPATPGPARLTFRQGDHGLTQLRVDPFMDPLRDDPRFLELLRKVGLAKGN